MGSGNRVAMLRATRPRPHISGGFSPQPPVYVPVVEQELCDILWEIECLDYENCALQRCFLGSSKLKVERPSDCERGDV
jgi:hypothetical protein